MNNVAFILGAGSANPYGFPTGRKLRDKIIQSSANTVKEVSFIAGEHPNKAKQMIDDLDDCNETIDEFISTYQRFNYEKIGKAFLTYYLYPNEKKEALLKTDSKENWYLKYWEYFRRRDSVLLPSNHTIVTFNYDRSFEYFMHFYRSKETGQNIYESIKKSGLTDRVNHVYGSFGRLYFDTSTSQKKLYGMPYYSDLDRNSIFHKNWDVEGLKLYKMPISRNTIHFKYSPDSKREIYDPKNGGINFTDLDKAIEAIKNSDTIVFLGYGFDDFNNRKLQLQELLNDKTVYATTLGLNNGVIDQFNSLTSINLGKLEFAHPITCAKLVDRYYHHWYQ